MIEAHEHVGGFIAEPAMVEIGLSDETNANIGRRIDGYEILSGIGQGGMAEIEEANANADPTNTVTARSVSEDYIKIGDELLKLGNRTDALNGYLKALQIRERIAATNPESAGAQVVSANFYESPGNCYFLPDVKQAKIRYKQSLVIRQELQFNNTILASDAKKPDEVRQKIEKCDAKLK